MSGDVIEILKYEEEEAINKDMQEEILMKVEPIERRKCCRMWSKLPKGRNLGDWPEHELQIGNIKTMS